MLDHQNIIGPVIRELRERKGLTQAQFVARLNIKGWDVSRSTLAKIESQVRCVSDYEIPVLATCIGVEPTELFRLALAKTPQRN